MDTLAEPWGLATYGYPLTNDMWTLRNKSDVDLVALYPNSPAFYDDCLSTVNNGKPRFITGKVMLAFVMLTAAAYSEVEMHIQEAMAVSLVLRSRCGTYWFKCSMRTLVLLSSAHLPLLELNNVSQALASARSLRNQQLTLLLLAPTFTPHQNPQNLKVYWDFLSQ